MTDVGHTGEAVAAKYYQQRGWLLLNHNYRTRLGELDLIFYAGGTILAVPAGIVASARAPRRNIFVLTSAPALLNPAALID